MNKTTPKNIKRDKQVIDAAEVPLGRLATQCAVWLQGKHKPEFVPYHDIGDYVQVVNADKIVLTGRKAEQKKYQRFTGYPGSVRVTRAKDLLENDPAQLIWRAVYGMLPINTLRRARLKRLQIETSKAENNK
ncbi:50S ribosomal protein L13 [Patescibacteria group bacterium]